MAVAIRSWIVLVCLGSRLIFENLSCLINRMQMFECCPCDPGREYTQRAIRRVLYLVFSFLGWGRGQLLVLGLGSVFQGPMREQAVKILVI